jgi:sterol desaturase/sphingolipid hydroxylase (fatty acid hydroxylase superfamily)
MDEWIPWIAAAIMTVGFGVEAAYSLLFARDGRVPIRPTLVNVAVGIIYLGFEVLKKVVIAIPLVAIYNASPWQPDMSSPWAWLFLLLLWDCCYYWLHRAEHTYGWLWMFHEVHHSAREFNYSVGMRSSWVGGFVTWFAMVPATVLGFHPVHIAIVMSVTELWDFSCHTQYVARLPRIVTWAFNTPSHHRVHHLDDEYQGRKNFGVMFFFWDRLFGTYRAEARGVAHRYGITPSPHAPENLLVLQFGAIVRYVKNLWHRREGRRLV